MICCSGPGLSAEVRKNGQNFEYESQVKARIVRNAKVLDYVVYAVPGSPAWKKIRMVTNYGTTLFTLAMLSFGITLTTIHSTTDSEEELETAAGAVGILAILFLITFSNIDTVLLRVWQYIFVFDLCCMLVVCLLLVLVGQGYVFYGTVYSINFFVYAYLGEAYEVDSRLNSRTKLPLVKITGYALLTMCTLILRFQVFLKQISAADDPIMTAPGTNEVVTVRDVWEFFFDILFVRMVYMMVNRMLQPMEVISLGQAYGRLKREP